jgi:hypothetical protein
MSYDLSFWSVSKPGLDALAIYRKFCRQEPVEECVALPVSAIKESIKSRIPEFNPDEPFPLFTFGKCGVEVSWSDRHFRFDFRGREIGPAIEAVCEAMAKFDLLLFDPQQNQYLEWKPNSEEKIP